MSELIKFTQVGDFKKTKRYLEHLKNLQIKSVLEHYGQLGVALLQENTPRRSGQTANSWRYEIEISDKQITLSFHNDNMGSDGKTPVAILIQMGHGTKNGGYVAPVDYINPVIKPLFDDLANDVWKAVTSL